MKKNKDGSFSVQIDIETGKDYQFRYVVDGKDWINDWEADRYEFNSVGNCENLRGGFELRARAVPGKTRDD